MKEQCKKVPQYKCGKANQNCLGCKFYNIYCAGVKFGRENPIKYDKYVAIIRVADDATWIEKATLKELHKQIKEDELEDFVIAIYGANELKGELELL